jgi:hypothetical protein
VTHVRESSVTVLMSQGYGPIVTKLLFISRSKAIALMYNIVPP